MNGSPISAGDLAQTAASVLGAIPFPALVLEVPSERIVAASPAATSLVDPSGAMIVGHLLEEYTRDRPLPGDDLFAGGRLNGFETFRTLRRRHGTDVKVRMWIRSFDRQPSSSFVVVVIVADGSTTNARDSGWREAPAVIGTANARLLVERISEEAEALFRRPVAELLGESLISLVALSDVTVFLAALSEASARQRGITVYLDVRSASAGSAIRCEVLLLPLEPAPSCAFVFLPTASGTTENQLSADLSDILLRLGHGAEIAQLAQGVFRGISEARLPGLSRLTTRELEIVTQLLDGERAPSIATKLCLSQSTVRNHLGSVFGKLGVTSQQGLLDAVRRAQSEERQTE